MARGKRAGARVAEATAAPVQAPPDAPLPPVVANGGPYGSRQATEEQASSAPMYEEQVQGQAAPVGVPPGPMPDAFGPSQRPHEPLTAGLPGQGQEADSVAVLRAIYKSFPSPWIAALIGDDF
jgi:hypothetical protein